MMDLKKGNAGQDMPGGNGSWAKGAWVCKYVGIVMLLLVGGASAFSNGESPALFNEVISISNFSDGQQALDLNFSDSLNKTIWIKIPKKAKISIANLNMSGKGEMTSADYSPIFSNWNYTDYSFLSNNWKTTPNFNYSYIYEINSTIPYDTNNQYDVINSFIQMNGTHHFKNLTIESGAGINVGSYPNSLELIVDNILTVNGTISADGRVGYCDPTATGGEGGGTINIVTAFIKGNGSISANGGNGANNCEYWPATNGGTGGNISIHNGKEAEIYRISANGGLGGNGGGYTNGVGGSGGYGGIIEVHDWDKFNSNLTSVYGGDGEQGTNAGGWGGNAGTILFNKINNISMNSFVLEGGNGAIQLNSWGASGSGGKGGNLYFNTINIINFNSIDLNGGNGANTNSYTAGGGGSAGFLNFENMIYYISGKSINASGAKGGDGYNGAGGGSGGTIILTREISRIQIERIQINGGNGGIGSGWDGIAGSGGNAGIVTFGDYIANVNISTIQANAGNASVSGKGASSPGKGTIISFGDYIVSVEIYNIEMNGGSSSSGIYCGTYPGSSGGSIFFGKSIFRIKINKISGVGGNAGTLYSSSSGCSAGSGGSGGTIILNDSVYWADFKSMNLKGGNGGHEPNYGYHGNKGGGGTFISKNYVHNFTASIEATEGDQYGGDHLGGKIFISPNSSFHVAADTNSGNLTVDRAFSFDTIGSLNGSLNITTGSIGIYYPVNAEEATINYISALPNNDFNYIISPNKIIENNFNCDFCWYFPTNPYLDTGRDDIIDSIYLGWLTPVNLPQSMDINASAINEYLENCTSDENGDCIVPIIVHSDSIGKLTLSNVSIIGEMIDTIPPMISIDSPLNKTYTTANIFLNVSTNEAISTWLYSLNGAPNVTFTPNTTLIASQGANNLIIYANDTAGNWNSSIIDFSVDSIAPTTILNLQNISYASTYINWTWTDPEDSDFSKVMIYLNGTFQTNITKGTQFYNATRLSLNTSYEISTHTVDASGNINQTWENHTAKTIPGRVHNIKKGTDYLSIQSAIDDASPADVIHVDSGMYYENVNVNKQIFLIGVNTSVGKPVVDAGRNGNTITLNANGITLEGLTAINASYPYAGIRVNSNNNILRDNNASNNNNGIHLENSVNNNITGNNASDNDVGGIRLSLSNNNEISINIFSNNSNNGIYFISSNSNIISGNIVRYNYYGIALTNSNINTIENNTISFNDFISLFLQTSIDNNIYNNFFNNNMGPSTLGYNSNRLNTTKTASANIVSGSFIGGNFWANPAGTGFSQTCTDVNRDGICDSSFIIDSGNIDHLPLVQPGYITGKVMNNSTGIAGAVVATNTSVVTTDASGFYSLLVPAGTYNLTATSAPGFYPNSSIVLTAISGSTISQDFELIKKPTGNITGTVTNGQ